MNRKIILGAFALYLMGAFLHLELFRQPPGTIWGDAGDGFFNLWVLHHVTESVARGDWNVADGRIFWPETNHTLFLSDNLFAIAPLFAVGRFLTADLFDAFRLTGIFLSMLHFSALLFLWHQAFALVRDQYPGLSPRAAWLIPVFAYLAHFSPAVLINHFLHIQNLSSLGIFVLLGAILAYIRNPAERWIGVMAASLVFMLYSTPYFAVAGFILLSVGLGFQAARNPGRVFQTLWGARWLLAAFFVPALFLAVMYLRVEGPAYRPSDIRTFSIQWSHLVTPAYSLTQQMISGWINNYPRPHNEKIAWLGPGLLIGLIVILGDTARRAQLLRSLWIRSPLFWIVILTIILLHAKIRELRPFLTVWTVLLIGVAGVAYIRFFSRQYRDDTIISAAAYLVMAAALMYGIAFGPLTYYLYEPVNPSLWGFLTLWVPGMVSIRAVGRMAFIGQVLLYALAALWIWVTLARSGRTQKRMVWTVVVLLCVLQGLDVFTVRARQGRYDESIIRPTQEEHAFFETIHGSLVSIPAHPFSRNTVPMLYFVGYPELRLMNGYSAVSTPVWDEVMRLERQHGACSPEQVQYVVSQGVDYIAVRLDFIRASRVAWLTEWAGAPVFENHRWAVYATANR